MKHILIFIFILFHFICRAEYDSTYVLSVTQKYAIPENVSNGDYVGLWRKTWTWKSAGKITYAIEKNFNNAFTINSSTGLLTISDASKINGKITDQDQLINLIIRTTDSDEGFELDTAKIWIKENSFCVFIDYTYNGIEKGKRLQPFNDLDDVDKTPGHGYFIKRGTRFKQGQTIMKGHIATIKNPTIFGAYGSGDLPVFDGRGEGYCFEFGNSANPDSEKVVNVKFYDLAIKGYTRSAWKLLRKSSFCGWYNCVSDSNALRYAEAQLIINTSNYLDSLEYLPNEVINCTFNRTLDDPDRRESSSLIKCGNGPLTTINCYFSNSNNSAWRTTCGPGSSLKHSVIVNSGNKGVQLRDNNITIEDVRIINSGNNGIQVTGNVTPTSYMPHSVIIKNCYIEQGGKDASIVVSELTPEFTVAKNIVIEDCYIKDGVVGIKSNNNHNLIIGRNTISGVSSHPIWLYSKYPNKIINPQIRNNGLSKPDDILIENGVNVSLLNNLK